MTSFKHVSDSIFEAHEKVTGFLSKIDNGYNESRVESDDLKRSNFYWAGKTLEKGGVHFIKKSSEVSPFIVEMTKKTKNDPNIEIKSNEYHVTGLSLIIHPSNPYVPTLHMNVRYFELGDIWWFGGGIDISPSYFNTCDIKKFHLKLRDICDEFGVDYETYKSNCDEYFYLPSREQTRGLGGIFFDNLCTDKEKNLAFIVKLALELENIYTPFLEYKEKSYTDIEMDYCFLRRGIYAEFIYLYDRGIKFGQNTTIHIKSMFSSLPPMIRYSDEWELTDEQRKMNEFFYKKIDWVNYKE